MLWTVMSICSISGSQTIFFPDHLKIAAHSMIFSAFCLTVVIHHAIDAKDDD
jgi:hypothetical protein